MNPGQKTLHWDRKPEKSLIWIKILKDSEISVQKRRIDGFLYLQALRNPDHLGEDL